MSSAYTFRRAPASLAKRCVRHVHPLGWHWHRTPTFSHIRCWHCHSPSKGLLLLVLVPPPLLLARTNLLGSVSRRRPSRGWPTPSRISEQIHLNTKLHWQISSRSHYVTFMCLGDTGWSANQTRHIASILLQKCVVGAGFTTREFSNNLQGL